MRNYYFCDSGFVERSDWHNCEWMDIRKPDENDIHFLVRKIGVPEMFLDYLSDPEERPRIEREDEWIMTILLIPVIAKKNEGMPYKTVPLGIIGKSDGKIITVCYYDNVIIPEFVKETRRKGLNIKVNADFTLRMMYEVSSWYLHFLKTLSNDVIGVEKDLNRSIKNDDLIRLMQLQKSLVYFNTSVKGNMMLTEKIQKIYENRIDLELLDDVDIELRQADSTVAIYSNILEGTMDAYASIISNNVNGVMKRMTGLTIILMVPTFIASLYGMNVDILIGGNRFAFWIILVIAAVLTTLAYIWLRKINWI